MKEMPVRVAGSFRDPRGYVVLNAGRLFRYLSKAGADDFNAVNATGLLDRLVADGRLLPWSPATPLAGAGPEVEKAIEHPMLRPITYPYEWTFSALKAAALLHLDLHLDALERDVTLVDASAYNVQFEGAKPVFIDHLSFRPYRDGEFWLAHRQFLAQFLYTRARMISGLTLLRTEDTHQHRDRWSYVLLAEELRRVSGNPRQDANELFRRMCFNALISNIDDHPRNHAAIAKDKDWKLSPAYDLTPSMPISLERRNLAMSCGDMGR